MHYARKLTSLECKCTIHYDLEHKSHIETMNNKSEHKI